MHVTFVQNFRYFKEGPRNFINQYIHLPNTTYILTLNLQLHSSAFSKQPSGCTLKGTNLYQYLFLANIFIGVPYATPLQRDQSPEDNRNFELHFQNKPHFNHR